MRVWKKLLTEESRGELNLSLLQAMRANGETAVRASKIRILNGSFFLVV
jgi:hypothetical protein